MMIKIGSPPIQYDDDDEGDDADDGEVDDDDDDGDGEGDDDNDMMMMTMKKLGSPRYSRDSRAAHAESGGGHTGCTAPPALSS